MKGLARFTSLLAIGICAFVVYLLFVGPELIITEMSKANLWLLLFTLPLDLAFMLLFGLTWHMLLKTMERGVSMKDSILISLVSLFGNIMIPTGSVTGEVIRLVLSKRKLKIGFGNALASILVHRIVNLMAFAPFLALSLALFWTSGFSNVELLTLLVLTLIVIVGGLSFLKYLSKSRRLQDYAYKASEKILKAFKKWSSASSDIIEHDISEFSLSLSKMFSKPCVVMLSFVIFLGHWAAAITIPYVVFLSLGYEVSYLLILAAYPIYSLTYMVPVGIPAMLGVVEASMTATFIALGIPPVTASSASILTRIVAVWFEVVVTGAATALYSIDIFRELVKRS
ncbi:MAG: flippase-like domain-containing protein [Candidatus Nezhaarchaeales archaeon]|nr:MAG: hypothetical protein DSO06_00775 [Candidatus Nezhaarchaeota archaeon WYZ-LMO8]TDA37405.1 MAG: hypothetical protein DSO05_00400 [Candidatus Nezhaarchaeota archaeon WYZ-LMO7]